MTRDLNVTTLYVTHDQVEALTLADRIAVMRDGRIEDVGTPTQVYNDPATAFVAGFLARRGSTCWPPPSASPRTTGSPSTSATSRSPSTPPTAGR